MQLRAYVEVIPASMYTSPMRDQPVQDHCFEKRQATFVIVLRHPDF
jgi:hypothetical protein